MNQNHPASTAARRARPAVLVVLAVIGAALVGLVVHASIGSSPSVAARPDAAKPTVDRSFDGTPRDRGSGDDDGRVDDGVTVFDDVAAVAELDPALLRALRDAATDASHDGTTFYVNSGWRSPDYQDQLLREAVAKYGSEAEAARWVATPETSRHVSGDAVDVGGADAMSWLSQHGAAYGLCQTYGNEPWHYELRSGAADRGCPPMYADPTQDPRMQ